MRVTKIDIDQAFIDYCIPLENGGYRSYAEIARKYNVSRRTIERIGTRNKWVERRSSVGVSKNAHFVKNYQIHTEMIYGELISAWLTAIRVFGKALENVERENPIDITSKELKIWSQGMKIVTDQVLKLCPVPRLVRNPQTHRELTLQQIKEIDSFLNVD